MIVAAPGHPLAGQRGDRSVRAGERALARRPAGHRPDDDRRAVLRAQRARRRSDIAAYTSHAAAIAAAAAGEGMMLALAHSVIDAMRRRVAGPARRARDAGRRAVAREHAGLGPRAAGGAGAAAVRHHARGDPGDVQRARRDRVGAGPAGGPRDPVAVGGRGDRRWGSALAGKRPTRGSVRKRGEFAMSGMANAPPFLRGRSTGELAGCLDRAREPLEHLPIDPSHAHRRERPLEESADPAGALPRALDRDLAADREGSTLQVVTNEDSWSRLLQPPGLS